MLTSVVLWALNNACLSLSRETAALPAKWLPFFLSLINRCPSFPLCPCSCVPLVRCPLSRSPSEDTTPHHSFSPFRSIAACQVILTGRR